MSLQNFNGYQVFLDIRLTVPREIQVKRTWFERLFSFSPLVKTKSKWIDVPSMEIILINNKMIMHPEAFKELKRRIVKNNGQMTFPRNKGKWKFDVVDLVDAPKYVSEEYSLVQSTGHMFNGIMTPDGRDYLLVRTMDHNSNILNILYKWGTEEIVTITVNSDLDYHYLAIDIIIRLKEVYHETCISDQI